MIFYIISTRLYYDQVRLGVSNLATVSESVSGPVVTRTVRERVRHPREDLALLRIDPVDFL